MDISDKDFEFLEQQLIEKSKHSIFKEFIGAVSHKWKQPLNMIAIIMQDLSLANQFGEINDEYIEKAEDKIMKQVESLSYSINDFKSLIQLGDECIEISLFKYIFEIREYFFTQLKNNSIDISFLVIDDSNEIAINETNYDELILRDKFIVEMRPIDIFVVIISIIKNIKLNSKNNEIKIKLHRSDESINIIIEDLSKNSIISIVGNLFSLDKNNKNFDVEYDLYMIKKIIDSYGWDFMTKSDKEKNSFEILLKLNKP